MVRFKSRGNSYFTYLMKKGKNSLVGVVFVSILLLLSKESYASNIRFEATVDRNRVALGSSLQLNLTFYGTQNIPPPDIGKIKGFKVQYLGPSTRFSMVNGKVSTSITHIYTLIPLKTGTFQLGPFSFTYQGKKFTSQAITVEVVKAQSLPSQPGVSEESVPTEELSDRIFLTMEVGKKKIYLNEVVPLTIKLYINGVTVRDIQYPEFEHEGFSIEKFPQPRQYRQNIGGKLYDVVEFHANIFAVKPGKLILGPATVKCKLLVRRRFSHRHSPLDEFFDKDFFDDFFDDFFTHYQSYPFSVTSPQIAVTVLPLPSENVPSDFKGAVGNFHLKAEVSPKEAKVGDPITLTITVEGKGNFNTVFPPSISSKKGFKVYEPEVKQTDDKKIFKQVFIPTSEEINSIPEITFSFFDPDTKSYHTIRKGPFPIIVKKPQEEGIKLVESVPQEKISSHEHLGRDIIYIKSSLGKVRRQGVYLYKSLGLWIFHLIAFLVFAGILGIYRRKEKFRTDERYARRKRASIEVRQGLEKAWQLLNGEKSKEFFDVVFKTIRDYLGNRLHHSGGELTVPLIEKVLKEKGVGEEILNQIIMIFEECEMVRYASSNIDKERMQKVYDSLKRVVNYLEKQKL
ncbi:MAG: hypothetical protein B6D56_01355 [Candidatus Omnitrophica bacterium 4484_70.1]|nr:MAG: hypothetical protein B6D56_01355 [Candidatus Omnitrophica bacterium 4484_70.1]